jgi:hypothetical protein
VLAVLARHARRTACPATGVPCYWCSQPIKTRLDSLKAQSAVLQKLADENPDFARSVGDVKYESTDAHRARESAEAKEWQEEMERMLEQDKKRKVRGAFMSPRCRRLGGASLDGRPAASQLVAGQAFRFGVRARRKRAAARSAAAGGEGEEEAHATFVGWWGRIIHVQNLRKQKRGLRGQHQSSPTAPQESLPPMPEGMTYQQAKDLLQQSTAILLAHTAQAVEKVKKEQGIESAEKLLELVCSCVYLCVFVCVSICECARVCVCVCMRA